MLVSLSSSVALTNFVTPKGRTRQNFPILRKPLHSTTADSEIANLQSEIVILQGELLACEERDRLATFAAFDENKDGGISDEELHKGLRNKFGVDYPKEAVKQAIVGNDSNKSGMLEPGEFDLAAIRRLLNSNRFVVDALMNSVQSLRERNSGSIFIQEISKGGAKGITISNKPAGSVNEDEAAGVQARALSTLAYLLPLLDGAGDYGNFIISGSPLIGEVLTPLIALYNAVPFLGLALFLLFSAQSQNLELPRLLRFNLQQAMLLDIALFFPGLVGFLPIDETLKASLAEPCSDVVFVGLFLVIAYTCLVNIITGKPPDKLPLISQAAYTAINQSDQQFDQ